MSGDASRIEAGPGWCHRRMPKRSVPKRANGQHVRSCENAGCFPGYQKPRAPGCGLCIGQQSSHRRISSVSLPLQL